MRVLILISLFLCGCQSEQVRPIMDATVPVLVEVFVPPQVKFWVAIAAAVLGVGGIGGVIGRKTGKKDQ